MVYGQALVRRITSNPYSDSAADSNVGKANESYGEKHDAELAEHEYDLPTYLTLQYRTAYSARQ